MRSSLCGTDSSRCLGQHFNNEKYEVAQYDKHLSAYEKASIKIATSLAYLNSGQNIIFSTALTMMMFLAAQGVIKGRSWQSSGLSQRIHNVC